MTSIPLCAPYEFVCCWAAGPGGHALRVLLDTGTDPSALDIGLVRRLALRTGGSGIGQGAASNVVPFTEAVLPWLRLGTVTIRDLYAPALDLSGLPFQIDVVLGYSVLYQMALRIDYQQRILTLAHPDLGICPSATGIALPLIFFEQFPALPDLQIADQHIPITTLDTGSNAALTVGPDVAGALGLQIGADGVQQGGGVGFGGSAAVLRGHYHSVQLGGIAMPHVELDTLGASQGDLGRKGRVNMGNRLLARFGSIMLDYKRCFMVVEPKMRATPTNPMVPMLRAK